MIAVSHNHVYKLFKIQVKKRIRLEASIWFVRVTPDEDNRKENKMKRVQQFAEKPLCMPGRRFFVQAMKHCVPSVLHTTLCYSCFVVSWGSWFISCHIFLRLSQLHVVHYNADRYYSLSKAVDKSDGLAVLGVLIEVRHWTLVTVTVSFLKVAAAAAESNCNCHIDWRVQSSLWAYPEVP